MRSHFNKCGRNTINSIKIDDYEKEKLLRFDFLSAIL